MLKDYQNLAIKKVRENAKGKIEEDRVYLEQICNQFSVDVEKLINQLLQSPITINFHPDRVSNNNKTVIENLLEQGQYYGQFRTGTTNVVKQLLLAVTAIYGNSGYFITHIRIMRLIVPYMVP